MKTITHALFTLIAVAAIAALASCGTDGNHFKIDGRLLNLNQGTTKSVNGQYHDRPIDIDILTYDDLHINTPSLTLPHPHMHERDFVMIPLREILDK